MLAVQFYISALGLETVFPLPSVHGLQMKISHSPGGSVMVLGTVQADYVGQRPGNFVLHVCFCHLTSCGIVEETRMNI